MIIKESTKISLKLLFIVIGTMIPAMIGVSKYVDNEIDKRFIPLQKQLDKIDNRIEKIYDQFILRKGK